MANDVPVLYTLTERRLLPLRERILEAIHSHPDELSIAEIIGLLEIIKAEVMELGTI